jgi:hypothetical protein
MRRMPRMEALTPHAYPIEFSRLASLQAPGVGA